MVSIVLVTYNRAERLKLSIQDILSQTLKNFELIICDDCSPDATEQICREFQKKDERVKYFRHERNLGMPGNCNFGIQKSIYEYIAILHDGDRFSPILIEEWYKAITSDPSIAFVFNSIGETDKHEKIVATHLEFEEGLITTEQLLHRVFFRRWRFDSPVFGEAMIRRKLIIDYGLMKKDYGFYADVDLWMHLLQNNNAYYCARTLITGPLKELQPNLFDNSLIKVFNYMYSMHSKNRKEAFKDKPARLLYEMLIFYLHATLNLIYRLILIVKNGTFSYFLGVSKLIGPSLLLIPWFMVLLSYPILFPALKLFNLIKKARKRTVDPIMD